MTAFLVLLWCYGALVTIMIEVDDMIAEEEDLSDARVTDNREFFIGAAMLILIWPYLAWTREKPGE